MPGGLTGGEVVAVVDGDTVDVRMNGAVERLRLIGINTPESVDPRRPVECFGKEASEHARQLLGGQQVLVESDPSQDTRDKYGRLLGYVWLPEGRLFNLQMIVDGYAYEYTYDNPYKYQATFKHAEAEARAAERGLWSPATCAGGAQPIGPAPTAQPGAATSVDCHAMPSGPAPDMPVVIVSIDKRAETVRLKNVSPAPVRLDGWTMCSIRGGQQQSNIGGVLQPGEERDYRQRGASIWSNNDRDDGALYDAQGRLVSYWQDGAS
jgi:micrococcal nuclease